MPARVNGEQELHLLQGGHKIRAEGMAKRVGK